MSQQIDSTLPHTLTSRAEILAQLVTAILAWGDGDEPDETLEQPFAHQKPTAHDVALGEAYTPSAVDAYDERTFTRARAEANKDNAA